MDNEAEVEVKDDVFEYFATQSEEVENEVDEIDSDTDDIEVLKERIAKRNKTIKKSKQANHRIQEENSALEKRMEELERRISSPAPDTGAQNQERKETLEKWRESVNEDPGKAVDFANWQANDLQERMVDLFTKQQETLDARFASINSEIDPEKAKYRSKLDALRNNPDFADVPDEHLIKFVKQVDRIPRGTIGGKKATAQPSTDEAIEAIRERVRKEISG